MKNKKNLSIFENFNFEYQPVGVKFLLTKSKGLSRLDLQCATAYFSSNCTVFAGIDVSHERV